MKTNTLTKQWVVRPLATIALITGLALGQSAQASTVTAAESPNSFSKWNSAWDVVYLPGNGIIQYDNGNGTIDDLTADQVRLTGATNGGGNSFTRMTTAAGSNNGLGYKVTFNWDYLTLDPPSSFDPFVFINDLVLGVSEKVTVDAGPASQSGLAGLAFFNIADLAMWGFALQSVDGLYNSASVIISGVQLTALKPPSAVPLPPALLLFGTAIAGLGFFRRKKQVV